MSVTEEHMGIGTWDIELSPGTPGRIINACRHFSKLLITPTYSPTFSESTVIDTAMYAGIKFGHAGPMRNKLEGYGAAAIMGPAPASMDISSWTGTNKSDQDSDTGTFEELVRAQVLPLADGITEGTLGPLGSSRKLYLAAGNTALDYLDRICEMFGNEWRLNPDLTLDARNGDVLFGTDPVALLSDLGGGRESAIQGYYTEIEVAEDVEDYAWWVMENWTNDAGFTLPIIANATAYDAPAVESEVYWIGPTTSDVLSRFDSVRGLIQDSSGGAAAISILQREVDKKATIRREVKATILDGYAVRRIIEPGNYVAVWHLWAGLFDQTNPYQYRGHYIFPVLARVKAIRWPIERGMGVFLRDSTVNLELHDLTPYVVWETGQPTELDIGANPRGMDPSTFQKR